MTLLDNIIGAKCHDCGARIKGQKFDVPSGDDGAKRWICRECFDKREALARAAAEHAERRKREMQDRWRLSPDGQVELLLPEVLRSISLNPDDSAVLALNEFCQQAENHWRGEKIQWRTRLNAERQLNTVIGSPVPQVRVFIARLLGIAGFVDSLPGLIHLAGSRDDSSVAARSSIAAIMSRLNMGDSSCPRCGCDVTHGPAGSMWRCPRCDLAYRQQRAFDPSTFRTARGVQRAPWNRTEAQELMEEVIVACQSASSTQIYGWVERAKQIAKERTEVVAAVTAS